MSTVFYGSLAIFSVYWLMFRYKVDYLLLWLIAIFGCANSFYYRMNMAKAPPLTIIFTIAGIYLFVRTKIHLASAVNVRICLDLQSFSDAFDCSIFLDDNHRLEREKI